MFVTAEEFFFRTECVRIGFDLAGFNRIKTGLLLGLCTLMPLRDASAQPRITLHIERVDYFGNFLRLNDQTLIAEENGELYRLDANATGVQKLDFDRSRPFRGIEGAETSFNSLVAPLADGGFLASANFQLPQFGSVERRLVRFDHAGRLVLSYDTRSAFIGARQAIELPDGRLLVKRDPDAYGTSVLHVLEPGGNYAEFSVPLWGELHGLAGQGGNILVWGNLYRDPARAQPVSLVRLNPKEGGPAIDTSFHAVQYDNIYHLAVQSDGRIMAARQSDLGKGLIFRLDANGTFEREFASGGWLPAFALGLNDELTIVRDGLFERYKADGSLNESGLTQGETIYQLELLPNGAFLGHWSNGDAGGRSNGWRRYSRDGAIDRSFPPAPLNFVTAYLSVLNALPDITYVVEESSDLIQWNTGTDFHSAGVDGAIERMSAGTREFRFEDLRRHFFRVKRIP